MFQLKRRSISLHISAITVFVRASVLSLGHTKCVLSTLFVRSVKKNVTSKLSVRVKKRSDDGLGPFGISPFLCNLRDSVENELVDI